MHAVTPHPQLAMTGRRRSTPASRKRRLEPARSSNSPSGPVNEA
jgi:hypothetical protein